MSGTHEAREPDRLGPGADPRANLSPAQRARVAIVGRLVRMRNRVWGLDRYREPRSYFEPGGFDAAAATCAAANRDLLAFVRPLESVEAENLRQDRAWTRRDGIRVEAWSFDSPLPSGLKANDRVYYRLYLPPGDRPSADTVVLFHHSLYGKSWRLWAWFFKSLMRRIPVAMMAGPHHYERTEPGRFPGEHTVSPNPAEIYSAMRQWCWDHHATVDALQRGGRRTAAEIGFSLGAFQSLLLASAGEIQVPIVSISSTNCYAYGVTHGMIGRGLRATMRRAGLDNRQFYDWTEALRLERYVPRLRGRPVLYIRASRDWVEPPPSLDRLEQALGPSRSMMVPGGHAAPVRYRKRVFTEIERFLEQNGVLVGKETQPSFGKSAVAHSCGAGHGIVVLSGAGIDSSGEEE